MLGLDGQQLHKDQVMRKLLIAVEQINKIPEHLLINFTLTLAVMDPTAVSLCEEMLQRWNNPQDQPSVKVVPLDDKPQDSVQSMIDDLEKQPLPPLPPEPPFENPEPFV